MKDDIITDDPAAPTITAPEPAPAPPDAPSPPTPQQRARARLCVAAFEAGKAHVLRGDATFITALVDGGGPWWNELSPLTRVERKHVTFQLRAAVLRAAAGEKKEEPAP